MPNKLSIEDLIAAVKAAKTKDGLEALVKEQLGLDIDKRRALKDLRTEVLAGLSDDKVDEELPELEDEPEQPEQPKQRLMRNKKTGRTYIWTPILAKLPDLEEV